MKEQMPDPSVLFKTKSYRHHYIPQFLLDAFCNDEGMLYVYDKKKKQLLKKPRPPKSVFFETERNTVELKDDITSSVIEDFLYKQIDDDASKIIRVYQRSPVEGLLLNEEEHSKLLYFLITLFWRLPYTDYAAEDLMNRSEIKAEGVDPEILRNSPWYRKMARVGISNHQIKQMAEFGRKGKQWAGVRDYGSGSLLIGDNPIVFEKTPHEFAKFADDSIVIALNSSRLYTSANDESKLRRYEPALYNAAVLENSVRYVASSNLKILERTILVHQKLVERGMQYSIESLLFQL